LNEEPTPGWALALEARLTDRQDAMESRIMASLATVRAALMERIDRLQDRVDGHAQDLTVALAAAQLGDDRSKALQLALLESRMDAAKENSNLSNVVHAMQRQIQHLQSRVDQLEGR
jgi:hypothetical protein